MKEKLIPFVILHWAKTTAKQRVVPPGCNPQIHSATHLPFLPSHCLTVLDPSLLPSCLHCCIQLLPLVLYVDFKPYEAELSFWL